MRKASAGDRTIGMKFFASDVDGTGGRLKADNTHFRVTEIPDVAVQPVTASESKYPYLVVRVRLDGWDTYGFVHRLAGELSISRERITWAGTKDKAAITTQLFSLKQVNPADLPDIAGAEIVPVGRFGRGLYFGDLIGNRFDLTVTNPANPEAHAAVTSSLREFGQGRIAVPNYFGHQRFGSIRPITHTVGFRILSRDWHGAVMAYLGETHENEPADTRSARRFVRETEDWEQALERFPNRLQHERRLLERLVELTPSTPAEYRSALDAFPESLQGLFVHAAQSYLFNLIVSRRMESGISLTEAIPGDIVCFTRETEALGRIPDIEQQQIVTDRRTTVINRHMRAGRALLTAPLIGTETDLGTGDPAALISEVMAETGITRADFDLPQPFHSTGTRRALLLFPDISVSTDPLSFSFGLPSGSYATVVMREYLKGPPTMLG